MKLELQKIEPIYVKFIFKSAPYEWVDCRDPDKNLQNDLTFNHYRFFE